MINENGFDYGSLISGIAGTLKPMRDYKDTFIQECKENRQRISTGIFALDIALNGGLANELYIMGAETSTGKSAFIMSLAQHIAMEGTNVLYFSLEMGRSEFVARGISAISYESHFKDKTAKLVTSGDVLYWTYNYALKDFERVPYRQYASYSEEYFRRYGEHLYILEAGPAGYTVRDIANIAYAFKKKTGKPVVVFIDYLQIIKADPEDRSQSDRKTKTDVTVTTLKALASQIGMPVFTVSSVGRLSYNKKVSLASMKESGDMEYTGSVMIGWNWKGVTDAKDDEDKDLVKQECRERGYREMELEVLKYRNAQRDKSINLIYYPAYNYFAGPDEDGFIPVGDEQVPFEKKKNVIIA